MDKQTYYSFNPWWEGKKSEIGIEREKYLKHFLNRFGRKQIEIITGSRRVGKTTLMKQLIARQLKAGVKPEEIFYLSCDHPQAIGVSISSHLNNFRKMFSHKREKRLLLFLDEVQESPNWQIELKSLYDTENLKIICSGSTSALIKSHGGKLTGRQIHTIIYPLSFSEFLKFSNVKVSFSNGYLLEKQAEKYLQRGGYPENVLYPSQDYMAALLDDIFLRDLVRVHSVKNLTILKDLFKILVSSVGSRTSYNKISNTLEISLDTVKLYIEYLQNAYLIKKMVKWSTSAKQRIYAQKKIYLLDTGLKTLLTGRGDMGFKAENVVYISLLRNGKEPAYFSESQKEVDFVVGDKTGSLPIEVKYVEKLNEDDKKLMGLRLFLKQYPQTKKACVVTKSAEGILNMGGIEVSLVPLWQYLLDFS